MTAAMSTGELGARRLLVQYLERQRPDDWARLDYLIALEQLAEAVLEDLRERKQAEFDRVADLALRGEKI